jgi:hypothetical protein
MTRKRKHGGGDFAVVDSINSLELLDSLAAFALGTKALESKRGK